MLYEELLAKKWLLHFYILFFQLARTNALLTVQRLGSIGSSA